MDERKYLNASFSNEFENVSEDFLKCTVSLVSDEQIANECKFIKDGIDKARYSLNYCPVIGWFKKDDNGKDDFSNHGIEYVISNDGITEVVHTVPFGVIIPNSSRYEKIQKDNGEYENYLVADCYLWKRYEKAIDVVKENKCNQSVEIKIKDFEYENSYLAIKEFAFTGVCILSENCQPAFDLAKIRTASEFNKDDFKGMFTEMNMALDRFLNCDKGGNEVADIDVNDKFADSDEDVVVEENTSSTTEENTELEAEQNSEMEATEEAESTVVEEATEEVEVVEEMENETDESVNEADQFNAIESEEYKELLSKYESLNMEHEELQTKYNALEEDNNELKTFKANIENEERKVKLNELFERFEELSEMEEFVELKTNSETYSLDELENKLYALLGKKAFSLKTKSKVKKENSKIVLENNYHDTDTREDNYGGLFNKYLKK